MTEEKFAKSGRYKIKGKHLHSKNYWQRDRSQMCHFTGFLWW